MILRTIIRRIVIAAGAMIIAFGAKMLLTARPYFFQKKKIKKGEEK